MRPRLFLDANVLFSAAYRRESGLHKLWRLPRITLVSSRYAIEEARRNLNEGEQRDQLAKLLESVEISDASAPLPGEIGLPEKDRPILEAALGAKCSHLLTGDLRHFGPYFGKRLAGVLVCSPGEYLRRFG
jgi:predicted nucleic acid-binding protein